MELNKSDQLKEERWDFLKLVFSTIFGYVIAFLIMVLPATVTALGWIKD